MSDFIGQLFGNLHGDINFPNLISVYKNTKKLNISGYTFHKFCEYIDVDKKHIYYEPNNRIYQFCYIQGFAYVPISMLDIRYADVTNLKERIKTISKTLNSYYVDGDFDGLFSLMDKRVLWYNFLKIYHEISPKDRIRIFLDIHCRREYGFKDIPLKIIDKIFQGSKLNKELPFKEEYIKVYRGVTHLSTIPSKAISWTLNREVAEFFAHRFDSVGIVYEAKIHRNHIYAYTNQRNEQEVLVNPKCLIGIKKG